MSSPITFSGFNNIDFNMILNAVMAQESRPLNALESRKDTLTKAGTTYASLSTKLGTLKTAAQALSGSSSVVKNQATTSNAAAVGVSATAGATTGRYDVVVTTLAKSQVMKSSSSAADADLTTVATGGTLTIGGTVVTVSGAVTLEGLADAINSTDGIAVTASVSETAPGAFHLILTSKSTGAANAFTVTTALTGSMAFTDTDSDGISGDSAADNAVQATNASLLINNIGVQSTTNTLTTAISGVTLTLQQADPATTVVVEVARDDGSLVDRVQSFASAYNALATFADDTLKNSGALGRDSLIRSLRADLRSALSAEYGSSTYTRLAEVGIGFTRTGALTLDEELLTDALQNDPDAVAALFADSATGAFGAVENLVKSYTSADGYVAGARTRLNEEASRITTRIADMEARLALRRRSLQAQFSAADAAMSRLNSQSGTLSSLGLRRSQF